MPTPEELIMNQGPLANSPGVPAGMGGAGGAMMPTAMGGGGDPAGFGAMGGEALNAFLPNRQNPNMGSENDIRRQLGMFMAMNPGKIAAKAGKQDIMKSMYEGTAHQQAMSPEAWNQLGSSNPNLLGMNQDIEGIIKNLNLEEPKKPGWLSKILKVAPFALNFIPGIGTAAMLAIQAGTAAASKGAAAKGW